MQPFQAILIVAFFPRVESCLASYNPDIPAASSTFPPTTSSTTTTTTSTPSVCPCSPPGTDVSVFCPNYGPQGGLATMEIVLRAPDAPDTDAPCTVRISGCTKYRVAWGPMDCQQDPVTVHDPTETRIIRTCNPATGVFEGGQGAAAFDCYEL